MNRYVIAMALISTACGVSADQFATKTSSGDISFALVPRTTADHQLVVQVSADTHSGNLADLDLGKLISLEVGGTTYHAVQATRLGGHHAAGSVTFDVGVEPKRFVITIGAVRGMKEQRIEWP